MDLDQAELVIERGRNATDLLSNPSFSWIVDDLTNQHLQQMVAAPPGERGREAREEAALMQHALTEIVSLLQGYAQTGAAMQSAIDDMRDDDEIEEFDTP